jgi:pimeloyl-ACP methyl ester carboxylesterase
MNPSVSDLDLDLIERSAERHATSCGAGAIVWRSWGEGPPLVLLHGDVGSWTHWRRNLDALSCRFRVLVPDMPGYGASDLPPEPWSPASLARIMADGLREIIGDTGTYGLAGFSFGGVIAGHWAAMEPERVGVLALLGPGALGIRMNRPPTLQRPAPGMNPAEVGAVHRHNLAALMFADPATADDLAVTIQTRNIGLARLRAGGIPDSDLLLEPLSRLRVRLHGIWGERDAFVAPRLAEVGAALRRCQPEADFRIVPAAGHWTPYEAAGAVNAHLTAIMTKAVST